MEEAMKPKAPPYPPSVSNHLEFCLEDVEDDNGNAWLRIVYDGNEYELVNTNSNYMTAVYRKVSER